VTTRITVTIGDGGLLDRNAQQQAAARQAALVKAQAEKAAALGNEQLRRERIAQGLDPSTGLPLPSFGTTSTIRRLDQQPAANRRPSGGIGFVLPPGRTFVPLNGPFGDFVNPGWPFGFQSAGITGLSKGYTNSLWGLQADWIIGEAGYSKYPGDGSPLPSTEFDQCIFVQGPVFPTFSPIAGVGGYQTRPRTERIDFCGSQPGLYELIKIGIFRLGHVIANGSGLRFQRLDGENQVEFSPFPLGDEFRLTRAKPRSGATLEAIVRLGAGPSTDSNGSNRFSIYLSNPSTSTGLGFLLDQGDGVLVLNSLTEVSNVTGGTDVHVAIVASSAGENTYVNGHLIEESGDGVSPFLEYSGPLICEVELVDASGEAFTEVNPFPDPLIWVPDPESSREHNGPSMLKGVRYTERALYTGPSFTPPTSLTQLV
jgi:hypothetical protein